MILRSLFIVATSYHHCRVVQACFAMQTQRNKTKTKTKHFQKSFDVPRWDADACSAVLPPSFQGRTATHFALCCSVLQGVAGCCSVLQCAVSWIICNTMQQTATHCNTLQHTATHYNTLRYGVNLNLHADCLKDE